MSPPPNRKPSLPTSPCDPERPLSQHDVLPLSSPLLPPPSRQFHFALSVPVQPGEGTHSWRFSQHEQVGLPPWVPHEEWRRFWFARYKAHFGRSVPQRMHTGRCAAPPPPPPAAEVAHFGVAHICARYAKVRRQIASGELTPVQCLGKCVAALALQTEQLVQLHSGRLPRLARGRPNIRAVYRRTLLALHEMRRGSAALDALMAQLLLGQRDPQQHLLACVAAFEALDLELVRRWVEVLAPRLPLAFSWMECNFQLAHRNADVLLFRDLVELATGHPVQFAAHVLTHPDEGACPERRRFTRTVFVRLLTHGVHRLGRLLARTGAMLHLFGADFAALRRRSRNVLHVAVLALALRLLRPQVAAAMLLVLRCLERDLVPRLARELRLLRFEERYLEQLLPRLPRRLSPLVEAAFASLERGFLGGDEVFARNFAALQHHLVQLKRDIERAADAYYAVYFHIINNLA